MAMDPRKFAAAVAVRRNNQSQGSIPKASSLVGGAHSVGPEPAGDYDEVDTLHRALGSAIVDKIMKAREDEHLAKGGFVDGAGDEFLDGDGDEEMSDDAYDMDSGEDESEGEDETGEGEGGTETQGSLLSHIFSKVRRRQMGR
jgi:hypothetical protein